MNVYALVLAGGMGNRLWPLSRKERPKQLLCLNSKSDNTMLYDTVQRIKLFISSEKVIVLTSKRLKLEVQENLKDLVPSVNIIEEEESNGTAAAIVLGIQKIMESDANAIVAVFPSDSYIENEKVYVETVQNAINKAYQTKQIVLIGVIPKEFSEGLGYFICDKVKNGCLAVKKFLEKPNIKEIDAHIKNGGIYTNIGMVVGYGNIILKEYFEAINKAPNDNNSKINDSFDKVVLEKYRNLLAVEGDFGWDDLGTLDKINKFLPVDEMGNSISEYELHLESENVRCIPKNRMIVTMGISDAIIVDTEDIMLVVNRSKIQDVKQIVEYLDRNNMQKIYLNFE